MNGKTTYTRYKIRHFTCIKSYSWTWVRTIRRLVYEICEFFTMETAVTTSMNYGPMLPMQDQALR